MQHLQRDGLFHDFILQTVSMTEKRQCFILKNSLSHVCAIFLSFEWSHALYECATFVVAQTFFNWRHSFVHCEYTLLECAYSFFFYVWSQFIFDWSHLKLAHSFHICNHSLLICDYSFFFHGMFPNHEWMITILCVFVPILNGCASF